MCLLKYVFKFHSSFGRFSTNYIIAICHNVLSCGYLNVPNIKEMKPTNNDELALDGLPQLSTVEEQLLQIYWCKKELDSFLPNIATYATPKEITAITLSQLAIMENHLIGLLQKMSVEDNTNLA